MSGIADCADQTNPLVDPDAYYAVDRSLEVALDDPRLGRITRLRLLTDPGCPFWDLSYCHGELKDGTPVRVRLARSQFSRRNLKGELLELCREAGVYGKGLGIFDALSTLR